MRFPEASLRAAAYVLSAWHREVVSLRAAIRDERFEPVLGIGLPVVMEQERTLSRLAELA